MQLIAQMKEKHAFVLGYLEYPDHEKLHTVRFMVDTGCSTTTLLPDDVTAIGIDCSKLKKSCDPVETANGDVCPYVLPTPDLLFKIRYGLFNGKEEFSSPMLAHIHCLPEKKASKGKKRLEHAYSVLGMDVLEHFKNWKWTEKKLILKT